MAAQHLSRDLVRPSSGLKEMAQTTKTINDALRTVTGCLRPTPADNLPILAGIQPAELRRKGFTS